MNISISKAATSSSTGTANDNTPRRFGRGFEADEEEEHHRDRHRNRNDGFSSSGSRQALTDYSRDAQPHRRASPPPRVIPVSGGSDWRQDRKRRLAASVVGDSGDEKRRQTAQVQEQGGDRINDEEQKSGLQVPERVRVPGPSSVKDDSPGASTPDAGRMDLDNDTSAAATPAPALSEDELARQALLSGYEFTSSAINSHRTIAQQAPLSEEDAFRSDASSRPDAPTLDDYAATPVEDFGKALLRGMGWKEGMGAGRNGAGPTKPAEVKKRSALLGLGAKERPGAGAATTVTGSDGSRSSSKQQQKRPDVRGYKPLVRRQVEDAAAGARSGTERSSSSMSRDSSRRSSPTRDSDKRRDDDHHRRRRHRDHDRDYDNDRYRRRSRSRSPPRRDRERDRRNGDDRYRYESPSRDGERDRDRQRASNRERDQDRRRPGAEDGIAKRTSSEEDEAQRRPDRGHRDREYHIRDQERKKPSSRR